MALTQKEIIDREQTNTDSVWLYLEGSFYKAYERSAFAFCTRIKDYKVLRKESKTLGRDILYVGFPMTALDRTLADSIVRTIDDKTLRIVLPTPISLCDFEEWRDLKEVEMASRAMLTPYSNVIEKTPVYKLSYDILSQIALISRNISKQMQEPFALRAKKLAYSACWNIRRVYDVSGTARSCLISDTTPLYDELCFLIQFLKDTREISLNSFALLSEQIESVRNQLVLLQRKATGPVPAEKD